MANDNLETFVIDKEGDIFLVCDVHQDLKVKIQVSSAILSRASPVFKAVLSPRFVEGTQLVATGQAEISLPEDKGLDMILFCTIVHSIPGVPTEFAHTRVHSLAVLCDKYNGPSSVRTLLFLWISNPRAPSLEQSMAFLAAGCVLRHPGVVSTQVAYLMLNADKAVDKIYPHGGHIPQAVIDNINKRIQDQKVRLTAAILAEIRHCAQNYDPESFCRSQSGTCTRAERSVGSITWQLMEQGVWPSSDFPNSSMSVLLSKLDRLKLAMPKDAGLCAEKRATCQKKGGSLLLTFDDFSIRKAAAASRAELKISKAALASVMAN